MKKCYKKFGGKEKKRTFAIPNEKRVNKTSSLVNKFIEKTENCTRSKYREKTIYREALILLELRVSVTS